MSRSSDSSNQKTILLGLLFLLLAGVVYSMKGEDIRGDKENVFRSKRAQDLVNQHMQASDVQLNLREQQARIEERRRLMEMENSRPQRKYDYRLNQFEISEYQETHAFNEQVGRGKKTPNFPSNPNELVQTELFKDQEDAKYTEAFKKEYARQFIENARMNGWEIQVDDSFRVTSVKPLQRKPSYQLFEGPSSGAR